MFKHIFGALVLAWVSVSGAAVVSTTLQDVVIGGHTYDVTFSQDSSGSSSFNDVFGLGSPSLTFTDSASAQAAAVAVRAAADAIDFDYTPANDTNAFLLAFSYTATTVDFYSGWSDSSSFDGVFGPFNRDRALGGLGGAFVTFALDDPRAVPEPGSLALLGLGLAGLAAIRKRKQA